MKEIGGGAKQPRNAWHQEGHSEVKLTGIRASEKLKAWAHESFTLNTSGMTWRIFEKSAHTYTHRVLMLMHSAHWSASTWVTLQLPDTHTHIPLAQSQLQKKKFKQTIPCDWALSGVKSCRYTKTGRMNWQRCWWTDHISFLFVYCSLSFVHTSSGCAQWSVRVSIVMQGRGAEELVLHLLSIRRQKGKRKTLLMLRQLD